jgi:hypothetical protein
VGSTPFPLFARVILAPVCGRAYSWPATLSCLTRRIKITNRAGQTNDKGLQPAPDDTVATGNVTDNRLRLFEIALVRVRLDHVASVIVKRESQIVGKAEV